jgi:hypothetical protein
MQQGKSHSDFHKQGGPSSLAQGGSHRTGIDHPESTDLNGPARLASPYPKCAASIPSAAIRIPCACSYLKQGLRRPQRWQSRRSNPATLTARRYAQTGNAWIQASALKCLATLRQDATDDSPAATIPRSQCRSRNSAVRAPSTGTLAMNRWFAGSPQGSRSWRQDTSTLTVCSPSAAP